MSYRGVKRLLGESRLELKCLFLFLLCMVTLITSAFWWYSGETGVLIRKSSQSTGRGIVDLVLFKQHWEKFDTMRDSFAGTGGSGVVADNDFSQLYKALGRDLNSQKYSFSFIYPKSTGKGAPTDEFEWRVLEQFTNAAPPKQDDETAKREVEFEDRAVVDAKGNPVYQYYQAVRVQRDCIACHSMVGPSGGTDLASLNEGDLMAVAKISIPDKKMQKEMAKLRAILIATAIITAFLAVVACYVIVRYVIVKPLKHLRDVSDEISHGNMSLRADIHTGDEFEELATAFNRMLRHLITVQEEIRTANRSLDGKVDELAQANMQLYEANRLKSDFLATMSHELRTPLNSILGFSDVLGGIAALDDKQKRYVKNIQNSGRMLLEMINDILDLAKIESGKAELKLSEFKIEPVASAQCDMARPLSERKNIDLDLVLAPELPLLRQDQPKVQQILNNLLSNAIKFTPEGGRITVSIRRDEQEQLEMKVTDTGVGIAEEDQQTIFEKFRQGAAAITGADAMTREQGGTGLGLSIVKELCKLLGGEISLESELGRGSTFTVTVPWWRADRGKLEPASDADREVDSLQTV